MEFLWPQKIYRKEEEEVEAVRQVEVVVMTIAHWGY
jgi:hypothetical protein